MEPKNEKVPGIKESYRLLTFEYAFRQVGFIVLLAIIVAAIAGLFSSGVVSDVEKTNDAKSLTLSYERFGRRQTESRMALTFPVTSEGKYTISLTSESSDAYEPGSVWPKPDSMYSRGNTLFLVYNNLEQNEKFVIQLFLTPSKAGKWTNTLRVNNEPEIAFWQFIYP